MLDFKLEIMNKFNIILGFFLSIIIITGSTSLSFADIPNPRQQLAEGVESKNIQCKESLVLFLRDNGQPICIKPTSMQKFVERQYGVADKQIPVSNSIVESEKNESSAIEINSVSTEKCPIENFLDVSNSDGAGSSYPKPSLDVYCDEEFVYVKSNGIPNYTFVQTTPNALSDQDYLWEIPLNPKITSQTSEIPLLGIIGFAVNGLPIYGPNEGPFPDPYGDPVYNDILDSCLGHTAQRGDYHYHAFALSCLALNIGDYKESPVLGYALDGFPIYGPYGCIDNDCSEIIKFKSSWVKTGDPTTYAWDNYDYTPNDDPTYLDECNGRYDEKLGYHYRATENFPYLLGCYMGEVSDSVNQSTEIKNNDQGSPPQGGSLNDIPQGCPQPGDPPPKGGLPAGCPLPKFPPPPR